jgi:hypothetical protein
MIPSVRRGQLWTAWDVSDETWDSSAPPLILVLALADEGDNAVSVMCLVDFEIREIHVVDFYELL